MTPKAAHTHRPYAPIYRGPEDEPTRTERHPDVTVSERKDQIIYGPKGEVLKRIEDRPFLGYGIRKEQA